MKLVFSSGERIHEQMHNMSEVNNVSSDGDTLTSQKEIAQTRKSDREGRGLSGWVQIQFKRVVIGADVTQKETCVQNLKQDEDQLPNCEVHACPECLKSKKATAAGQGRIKSRPHLGSKREEQDLTGCMRTSAFTFLDMGRLRHIVGRGELRAGICTNRTSGFLWLQKMMGASRLEAGR